MKTNKHKIFLCEFRKHEGKLKRILKNNLPLNLRTRENMEEIIQDVQLNVYNWLKKNEYPDNLYALLRRSLINRIFDEMRTKTKKEEPKVDIDKLEFSDDTTSKFNKFDQDNMRVSVILEDNIIEQIKMKCELSNSEINFIGLHLLGQNQTEIIKEMKIGHITYQKILSKVKDILLDVI